MSFVSPTAADFEGPIFQNYRKAVLKKQWSTSIDFSIKSTLPEWKQDLAFAVAAQACHAEHLGMCTAAKLVLEAPTARLRYAFAAAAQDEATHSDVLGRYATCRGGVLQDVNEHHAEMVNPLLGDDLSYEERATLHTLLEGFALDQFKTFVVAFQGDLLGNIYSNIRLDEARHVALGLLALNESPNLRNTARRLDLDRVNEIARKLGGLGDNLYDWLATIEGVSEKTIKRRYESNHAHRINEIRSIIGKERT